MQVFGKEQAAGLALSTKQSPSAYKKLTEGVDWNNVMHSSQMKYLDELQNDNNSSYYKNKNNKSLDAQELYIMNYDYSQHLRLPHIKNKQPSVIRDFLQPLPKKKSKRPSIDIKSPSQNSIGDNNE